MILVDTSVWIDHLRERDDTLAILLQNNRVLTHPFVIGELAMGSMKDRDLVLHSLRGLPTALVGREDEVLQLVARRSLSGIGLGYIDAHLLVAAQLTPDARLWTRDKRLHEVAVTLDIACSHFDNPGYTH